MKKILASVLAMAMAFSMTACGPEPAAPEETDKPQAGDAASTESTGGKTGGMLMAGAYILDSNMTNLVPFANPTVNLDYGVFGLVYEGLFYYNNKTGTLESALGDANTLQWNDSYTELTIDLNKDAKWHDGEDFTAKDVVFTYELLRDNATYDEFGLWQRLSGVKADGDDRVVISCKEPFVALPNYMASIFIVPEHQWAGQDLTVFTNNEPIGTGPFVYTNYTQGTSIEYKANQDYWKGAPKVDGMTVVLYNSSTNLTLALIAGEIDTSIDNTIVMSSVSEFMAREGAKMDVFAGARNFSVMMNQDNKLLADPAVRKAMCMAVDTGSLIARGEYNCVLPTSIAWLPDIFGDYVNQEAVASLTYDVEAAKKVLEDAGYSMGKDGIYQNAAGERLSFVYYNASGAPAQQMEGGMIQQWLLNVGIEIIPRVATWAELDEIAKQGTFDLLQNGISFPNDAYAALSNSFSTGGNTNYFRYSNPKVDELLAKASKETDSAALKDIYYEIQSILASDYVFIPMYNGSTHQPYLDGVNFTGWTTVEAPITSTDNLISIHPVG